MSLVDALPILDIEQTVRTADIKHKRMETCFKILDRLHDHAEDQLVGEPMHTQLHLIENLRADILMLGAT